MTGFPTGSAGFIKKTVYNDIGMHIKNLAFLSTAMQYSIVYRVSGPYNSHVWEGSVLYPLRNPEIAVSIPYLEECCSAIILNFNLMLDSRHGIILTYKGM